MPPVVVGPLGTATPCSLGREVLQGKTRFPKSPEVESAVGWTRLGKAQSLGAQPRSRPEALCPHAFHSGTVGGALPGPECGSPVGAEALVCRRCLCVVGCQGGRAGAFLTPARGPRQHLASWVLGPISVDPCTRQSSQQVAAARAPLALQCRGWQGPG